LHILHFPGKAGLHWVFARHEGFISGGSGRFSAMSGQFPAAPGSFPAAPHTPLGYIGVLSPTTADLTSVFLPFGMHPTDLKNKFCSSLSVNNIGYILLSVTLAS
jgi:hypothetical protein